MKKDATQAMFEMMSSIGENADIEAIATKISGKYGCNRNDLKTRYRAKAEKHGKGFFDFSREIKCQIEYFVNEGILTAREIAAKLKRNVSETTKIARKYGYKRTTQHNRAPIENIDSELEEMQKAKAENILYDLGITKEEVMEWQKPHLV